MKKIKLPVKGMTCAHCSKTVETVMQSVGVEAKVNLSQGTVTFKYDEGKISLIYLQRLIKKAGYNLVLPTDRKRFPWLEVRLYSAIAILILSLIGMIHHLGVHSEILQFFDAPVFRLVLASISLIVLGLPFNIRAIKNLKNKMIGMDFLVSMATLIAFILSLYTFIAGHAETYFETTSMILAIITIGDKITDKLKKSTGTSTQNALKNDGQKVIVINKRGSLIEMDLDDVEVGDLLLVKKGEMIGADGTVEEGEGLVDEKILTGESRPRPVGTGDQVYYGTSNLGDSFKLRVEKPALTSLFTGVILESYALDRSGGHLNKISDFIASIFVPVVLVVSILGFIINYFAFSRDVEKSVINAVSILVVSCPCAFGLAVPLASLNGYNKALRSGIMFKSGSTFEKIKKVNQFYFDKTGTLTTGDMKVTFSRFVDEADRSLVKALEMHSLHPIAKGIVEELKDEPERQLEGVRDIPGKGLTYGDYRLGSLEFVGNPPLPPIFAEAQSLEGTRVYLAKGDELRALLVLEDQLAPGADRVISTLKHRGIKTYMLTGDNRNFAYYIGQKLGLDQSEIFYELLPQDKIKAIEESRDPKSVTAYCGDGVNDLLALSLVDLSVASYKASAAAASQADVLLLKDDMALLGDTIDLSRHVYYNIIENFIWAFAYNAVMIPLALLGTLTPTISAILMIVSNITLILNSWRIRFWKGGRRHEKI